ncbi:hypothetical protein CCR94_20630 [Rhodoblastus sphagnicola]|uniref:Uncharacterized protein n=1 Tax=Rhodoblastus sphagnicola TaxID=333368 RepID=A0A2S6MY06_9HYPH|nr:hypothetical protein [Rhodoblastus sphagnicola]MBB4198098.1 hypothetical protein [Rhodoblastus sphagnicola]PPQ27238.1 hypothetical protein CCR94_20630 [Rhodoblastus sphagnicola]
MPSLGFSVEHKAPIRRGAPATVRRDHLDARGDGGFVVGMVALGLLILSAAACQDSVRLMFARIAGLF